jgi:outer membrane receptor protein involved in Fe transport
MIAALGAALALVAGHPSAAQDPPPPASPSAPTPATPDVTVNAVTVNGKRAEVETSIGRRSYSVANDLSAQTGSVADVLRNIPAVQVDVQGNPSLQGQGNVTILIDGRPSSQFSGQSLGQALQAMPAGQIDRIEVMTSPPAEFQAAGTGGIINLITKKAKGAGRTGSLRVRAGDYGRAQVAATMGYNADKVSATGDVTYRRQPNSVGDILDLTQIDPRSGLPVTSEDVGVQHFIGDYGQVHAGVDYDLDARTHLSGSARFSSSRYDTHYADSFVQNGGESIPASSQLRTDREFELFNSGDAQLGWKRTYGPGHDLSLNATYTGSEFRNRRSDLTVPSNDTAYTGKVAFTDAARRARFTADYQDGLASGAKVKLGYVFEYAPNRFDQSSSGKGGPNGPPDFDPALHDVFLDTETDNAVYASYERTVGKTTMLAGLRAEDAHFGLDQQTKGIPTNHDYPGLYPNLNLSYALSEYRKLTATFSRRTNRPNEQLLDPFPTSSTPLYFLAGNPDLRPEDYYRYEVGYENRKGDRTISALVYYRNRRDAINQVYENLPGGVFLRTAANAGSVNTAGAEWTVSDKLSPKLSYSFSVDAYWVELSAPNLGVLQTSRAFTQSARANLTWQITPKDVLQLSAFANGKTLQAQGYFEPAYSGNIGYRHTLNAKTSWLLMWEDPFHTSRNLAIEKINGVANRQLEQQSSRAVSLAIVWNFGGKAKDAGFDFGSGGGR